MKKIIITILLAHAALYGSDPRFNPLLNGGSSSSAGYNPSSALFVQMQAAAHAQAQAHMASQLASSALHFHPTHQAFAPYVTPPLAFGYPPIPGYSPYQPTYYAPAMTSAMLLSQQAMAAQAMAAQAMAAQAAAAAYVAPISPYAYPELIGRYVPVTIAQSTLVAPAPVAATTPQTSLLRAAAAPIAAATARPSEGTVVAGASIPRAAAAAAHMAHSPATGVHNPLTAAHSAMVAPAPVAATAARKPDRASVPRAAAAARKPDRRPNVRPASASISPIAPILAAPSPSRRKASIPRASHPNSDDDYDNDDYDDADIKPARSPLPRLKAAVKRALAAASPTDELDLSLLAAAAAGQERTAESVAPSSAAAAAGSTPVAATASPNLSGKKRKIAPKPDESRSKRQAPSRDIIPCPKCGKKCHGEDNVNRHLGYFKARSLSCLDAKVQASHSLSALAAMKR